MTTPCKTCSRCGKDYPPTAEFFTVENGKIRNPCRKCESERVRAWKHLNPERAKAAVADWKTRNTERLSAYSAQYRHDRRDHIREIQKQYRESHRDELRLKKSLYHAKNRARDNARTRKNYHRDIEANREKHRQYQRENLDVFRATFHRRRARKLKLPDTFSTSDWERALNHFDHRCAACGRPVGLWHTLAPDHWIPLSHPDCPGTVPHNIVPLCHAKAGGQLCCNNTKSNRDAIEWLNATFGKRRAKEIRARVEVFFASLRG